MGVEGGYVKRCDDLRGKGGGVIVLDGHAFFFLESSFAEGRYVFSAIISGL
jgi:hypothetical protein